MSEREIAKKARNMLYHDIQQNITRLFDENTGTLRTKTFVKSYFSKDSQMTRLAVSGPKHLFVQNYGFEGVKSTGINMRLKSTEVVDSAIERSGVVDFLATALSESRADEIMISFRR